MYIGDVRGHNVSIRTGITPSPSFSVRWGFKFGSTEVNYLMSSPDRLYGSGSTDKVSLTSNINVSQQQPSSMNTTLSLNNYPNLPWATNSSQEIDGKHVTYKIDGKYMKSNVYKGKFQEEVQVEIIIYVGSNNYGGSYNVSGNYKISVPPTPMSYYYKPLFPNVTYID